MSFHLTQQRPGHHIGWVYASGLFQESLGFFVTLKRHGQDPTHHQAEKIIVRRNKILSQLRIRVSMCFDSFDSLLCFTSNSNLFISSIK